MLSDLRQIYLDNLLYAQKAVSLWVIDPAVAYQLVAVLPRMVDAASPYRRTYPLPLPEADLRSGIPQGIPTEVHEADDRTVLVLGSKRYTVKEVAIPHDDIPPALMAEGYTELVAKTRSVSAAFDCIAVDSDTGLVEMRIDQARSSSEKELIQYRETLRCKFNELVRTHLGIFPLLDQTPTNLFPALDKLYMGQNWTVQRLGHMNEGGYINSNRGRHRTDDVRKDNYHKAGEGAVDSLQVWSLTAIFNSPEGHGKPILELEGHSKLLSSLTPHLDQVKLLDCTGQADYGLLLETLLHCLAQEHNNNQSDPTDIAQPELLAENQ